MGETTLRKAILPQSGEGPKQNCRIFTGSKARPASSGELPCQNGPPKAILYRKNGEKAPERPIPPQSGEGPRQNCRIFTRNNASAQPGKNPQTIIPLPRKAARTPTDKLFGELTSKKGRHFSES